MRWIGFFLLILAVLGLALPGCTSKTGVEITEAWARPGLAGDNTGAFFKIQNHDQQPAILRSASGRIAKMVELHLSKMDNGVMIMEPQESVEVAAQQTIEFKPGSYHVMLMNLNQDLKVGDSFDLTLQFDPIGAKTIRVTVKDQ